MSLHTTQLNEIQIVDGSFDGRIVQSQINNWCDAWGCIRHLLMPSYASVRDAIYQHWTDLTIGNGEQYQTLITRHLKGGRRLLFLPGEKPRCPPLWVLLCRIGLGLSFVVICQCNLFVVPIDSGESIKQNYHFWSIDFKAFLVPSMFVTYYLYPYVTSPADILFVRGSIGLALHIARLPIVRIRDMIPANSKEKQRKKNIFEWWIINWICVKVLIILHTVTLSLIPLSLWINSVVDLAFSDNCCRLCDNSVCSKQKWTKRSKYRQIQMVLFIQFHSKL